jgi:hypothetical protein
MLDRLMIAQAKTSNNIIQKRTGFSAQTER